MKRTGTLVKRGDIWHLRYMVNGVRLQISLKTSSKAEAEKQREIFMRDRQGDVDQYEAFLKFELDRVRRARLNSDAEKLLLSEVWDRFIRCPKRPKAKSLSINHYKSAWDQFCDGLPATRKAITDIDRSDAVARMEAITASGLAQSTAAKHLIYLKAIFSALLPVGMDNPFGGLEARGSHEQASYRPFSLDQIKAVLATAKADGETEVYGAVLVLAYTGLRLVDACTLKIEEVFFDRNVIERVPEKTKRYATNRRAAVAKIGLHPALRFELARIIGDRKDGFIFPTLAKWRPERRSGAFQKVIKAAGAERMAGRASGGARNLYGTSSFRHTMEDRLRESQVQQTVINTILCHQDRSMAATYSTVRDEEVIQAIVKAYPDLRPDATGATVMQFEERKAG